MILIEKDMVKRNGLDFGQVIVWLIIFIVGSLIVFYLISPNSFDNIKTFFENKSSGSMSITELAQNPTKHIGEQVSVSGELVGALFLDNPAIMQNAEGYNIYLVTDKCREKTRTYHYNTKYSATGIWNGNALECTSPVK